MTYEDIMDKQHANRTQREDLTAKIDEVRAEQVQSRVDAERLASAGDLEGYMKAAEEAEAAGRVLHGLRIQLAKCTISQEDIDKAWETEKAAYHKKLEALMKAHEKTRDKMHREYLEIIELNAETRKRCCIMYSMTTKDGMTRALEAADWDLADERKYYRSQGMTY